MLVWAAFFVLAAFSVGVSSYAINNRKKLELIETQLVDKIALLTRELDTVNGGAIGVGQNLINIEKKLNIAIAGQELLQASAEHQPYGQAEMLASQGVDPGQLAERFGLSESEAQLMSLLQQRTSTH
ncbi:MAG: hypothetical protein ACJA0N_000510 [Pseudohongiellaceae bacterium]|jgi:hypothetical protein